MNTKIKIAFILLIAAVMVAGCKKEYRENENDGRSIYKMKKTLTDYSNPMLYGNIHNQVLQEYYESWLNDTSVSVIDYLNNYFNVNTDSMFMQQNSYIQAALSYSTVYDWLNSLYECNYVSVDCKNALINIFYTAASEHVCADSILALENQIQATYYANEIENILVYGTMSILKQSYIYWSNNIHIVAWKQVPYTQQEVTLMTTCPSVDIAAMTLWLCVPGYNYIHAYDMAGFAHRLCQYITCDQNNFHYGIVKECIVEASYYSRKAAKENE